MKRSDFIRFWGIYGLISWLIGLFILSIAIVNGNKGHIPQWLACILLIFFVVLSIGWTIDTFLEYVEETENGVPPVWHYNRPYQSSITFGSYCIVLTIFLLGFEIHPEKIAIFCLPLLPVVGGITLGTYAAARIYLTHKGYDMNIFITTLDIIFTIILMLPLLIPIIYIANNGI